MANQPTDHELQELIQGVEESVREFGSIDSEAISEAKEALSQLILNDSYNSDKFLSLVRTISGREDGNFDGPIRLPMLEGELSPEALPDTPVKKSEVGPLLLAMKAQNAKAVKDLLS